MKKLHVIGAPLLIEELKKRDIKDGICIIGEPTNMKIIDAHKGMNEYTSSLWRTSRT